MTPRPAARLRRLTAAPPDPDRHLLAAFLADRSEPAFAELVRRHGPLVYGVCRRVLGHVQDAEDAFQATFLVLARKAGAVTRAESLSPWLYAVAVRTARELRHMRDRRRTHELLASGGCQPPVSSAHQQGADAPRSPDPDLVALLDEELAKLPDHYRRPVVLCELQGRPRKAVAAELGIPEGTLSSRLAAAKKKLAARLARRGVTATAAAVASVLAHEAAARVPSALLAHAARAAGGVAAASPVAAHVADGVVKALFVTKLKGLAVVVGLAAVGLGGAVWVPGPGGSSPAAHAADTPAKPVANADALVRQLGSPKFADRETAEKALRALGAKAKPAVMAGVKDPDPEVAKRSAAVLDAIRKEQFWPRFKELLGDDADARALFDAIRSVPRNVELIEAAEENPADAAKLCADRRRELNDRTNPPFRWTSAAEVAGFLYLGTFPGAAEGQYAVKANDDHFMMPYSGTWHYADNPLSAALAKGPLKVAGGRLLVKWTQSRTAWWELRCGLTGAITYGLTDIVPFAKTHVRTATAAGPFFHLQTVPLAVLAVGKLGTKDDLPFLLAFASNKAIAHLHYIPYPGDEPVEKVRGPKFRPGKDASTELRDVAVVAALVLCGRSREQIDEYGFFASRHLPRADGAPLPPVGKRGGGWRDDPLDVRELGFVRNEDREAAHTKARAWLAGQVKPEREPDKKDPEAEKLVKQLGSPAFADREAAEKQLRAMGLAARTAVAAGRADSDPEVARRCNAIWISVRELARAEFINQLRADTNGTRDFDHPVWRHYRRIAGDTPAARQLLTLMLSDARRAKLLDDATDDPARANSLHTAAIQKSVRAWQEQRDRAAKGQPAALADAAGKPGGLSGGVYAGSGRSGGKVIGSNAVTNPDPQARAEFATLLFLGTFPPAVDTARDWDYHVLGMQFEEVLRDPDVATLIDGLYSHWLLQRSSPRVSAQGWQRLAARGTEAAVPAARAAVAADGLTPAGRGHALALIVKAGTPDDAVRLRRFFDDSAECNKDSVGNLTQVRDVAVAGSLVLAGQEPADFGFPNTPRFLAPGGRRSSFGSFHVGFPDEKSRTAAHAKAKAWLAAQKK